MLYFFHPSAAAVQAGDKEEVHMSSVMLDRNGFVLNGKRQVLLVGSLFYFRIPRAAWRDRMEKMKEAGYHALDVYFPWNHHETAKDQWDFAGERDVEAFLTMAEEVGLYVVARPGPYICSEWDGGGLPAYLFAANMRIRDNDPVYLQYVQKWFDRILPIVCRHQITLGGCVIAMQLENELDFFADTKDRHGYISALRQMAISAAIDVPLFCCAGQGGIDASGGLIPGVFPAMNFYPPDDDSLFGQRVLFYQKWLSDQGFPLLVTETNRDHHFLRLLLLLGVKLIGPYNQAGGTDFGFTTAINNWGEPLSFQTSDYDFASLITPSGEYRKHMVLEARILRRIIDSVPGIAEAVPCALPKGFTAAEDVFATALALPHGGIIAGGMVYGREERKAVWPEGGYEVSFLPGRCPLMLSGVSLKTLGMDAEITFANAAPVLIEKGCMVFAAEQQKTHIVINDKPLSFKTANTQTVDGISVTLLPWEKAAAFTPEIREGKPVSVPFTKNTVTDADLFCGLPKKTMDAGRLTLEANGILNGYGLYEARLNFDGVQGLLFTDAADVLTVTLGGRHMGVFSPEGHSVYLPTKDLNGDQSVEALAEIWGHSNFDDHRTPTLRVKSTRGIKSIVAVSSVTPLPLWLRTDSVSGAAPQLTVLGNWLTTDMPACGVFRTHQNKSGGVQILHLDGLLAKAQVYVNGVCMGLVNRFRPFLDISATPCDDGVLRIECHVEKMDYCEPCGTPVLYQGDLVQQVTVKAVGEEELYRALAGSEVSRESLFLPLQLGYGQKAALHGIIADGDCEIILSGHEIKATILRGGHVCGRLVLGSKVLPAMKGGRPQTAFLPACWGNDVYMYLEPVTKEAKLTEIRIRTLGTYLPEE